ncbi:MAG: MBOAT family protein, partial [Lentisphaeria bacterium]|nr:MBOAT family protein [Lentisphaeria bacterium]
MLFQSWSFLICFLPFAALYALLRRTRLRLPLLLAGSYAFYACWDFRSVFFLALITLGDYGFGRGIAAVPRAKKWFLGGSLLLNLGVLCSFKYLNFITENLLLLLEKCGVTPEVPEFDWLLPVGLSFFTFKSMSYTCDVYFGRLRAERDLLRYAAYVSFFPQLIAGPIERAGSLLPQLRHAMPLAGNDFAAGASIFLTGVFKKVVMADMLAAYVNPVYDAPAEFGGAALLCASYAFAWQIYFDFSGLSDMARGAARLLGFRTVLNFDNPYVAVDVRDFWRRWHISLSSWFRDYLYIPLGGSRRIRIRVWWNVLVTMLVSGLWHGAAWTFIVWGGLNGLGSIASSEFDRKAWYQKIPKLVKQLLVFNFITLTWVFFRAASFDDAFEVLRGIFTWRAGEFFFPAI